MDVRFFGTNLLALGENGANAGKRATEADEDAYYRSHAPSNRRALSPGRRIRRFSMAMLALGALSLLAATAEAAGGVRTPDSIDDVGEPEPIERAIRAVDVDLELVLAVDVSHSMSGAELSGSGSDMSRPFVIPRSFRRSGAEGLVG